MTRITTSRQRVAVTGLGVKTAAGNDLETFWDTLCAGRSMARRITAFDADDLMVNFACEVRDFDPQDYLDAKGAKRMDRTAQLGFAAATDALADAGRHGVPPERRAVVTGTGHGGTGTQEDEFGAVPKRGYGRVSPHYVPMTMANATAGAISIRHELKGPSLCICTACASGAQAVGEGARLVREGAADLVVAGGCESAVAPLTMSSFARMGALSKRVSDPERASRPFDADRDGFVMGEGAGFVILENWDHAVSRGARIYGELAGYGRNSDAHHITAPSPDGTGARTCMELALADAGLTADEIVHINAHGTSTPLNDVTEARAIVDLFGAQRFPVTSTKSVIGHLIGAAGAVEAVATLLTMREGIAHPTANLERRDPGCDLDVVAERARKIPEGPMLSNSFGFGGHNATLVFLPAAM
ncbi:beta-ketoacyl-ACP synthase II [Streptomyces sp. ME19-01-6]|uniref:beta-ketoacyl-ACP synthase II n=1 Tax=Streptomyces sp. ME19-01-6 TaxID=3028686 RepID=UPI0029A592CB|nr:beta-ketoacyl-ACP synthase II [Streptomyces sp. ME19-01-6]MDX3225002.1 beta-ketoacyl-ACP synthase II [Streptomyces sp. ME19-01-6]